MKNNNQEKNHTIVLLHYFGGSAESWKWMVEQLPETIRCMALNLPGFGNTPRLPECTIAGFARYVLEEMDKRQVHKCTLIGHSMGGKIALQIAALDKDKRISKIVLIAPSPPGTEPMKENERERMLHHNLEEAQNTVKKVTRVALDRDKFEMAVRTQLEIEEETWKWWLQEGMNHPITDVIQSINVPVMVLASDDDPVMTPEVIQNRVMDVLKNAEIQRTQDVGHLIPMEVPKWTADMILKSL